MPLSLAAIAFDPDETPRFASDSARNAACAADAACAACTLPLMFS